MNCSSYRTAMTVDGVKDLVETRGVIICCGAGGVGKTTVAASLGVAGAQLGRRV